MKADTYVPVGVPVIRGTNISNGRGFDGEFVYISESFADELRNCNVFPGDLVFPHRGAIGEVGLVPQVGPRRWMLSTSLMKLSCDRTRADSLFFYYFFRSAAGRHELLKNASQVGTPGIGQPLSSLKSCLVPMPPFGAQRRIAAILGALDDKIELNRKMNRTLEEMAQALFKSWFIDFDGHAPAGLVDSDIGPIPRGWHYGRLNELARPGKYATTAGPFGSKLTSKHYAESGVPVIRGVNLAGSLGWFHDDDFVFVSEEYAESLTSNMAFAGDVIFTQRGTLGQVGLIPSAPRFSRYVLSQSQMKLTCAPGVPAAFVYLYFRLPATIAHLQSNAVAAGVPHVNLTFLRDFPIIVPDAVTLARFNVFVAPIDERITSLVKETATLAELRDTLLPKLISGELGVPEAEAAIESAS